MGSNPTPSAKLIVTIRLCITTLNNLFFVAPFKRNVTKVICRSIIDEVLVKFIKKRRVWRSDLLLHLHAFDYILMRESGRCSSSGPIWANGFVVYPDCHGWLYPWYDPGAAASGGRHSDQRGGLGWCASCPFNELDSSQRGRNARCGDQMRTGARSRPALRLSSLSVLRVGELMFAVAVTLAPSASAQTIAMNAGRAIFLRRAPTDLS